MNGRHQIIPANGAEYITQMKTREKSHRQKKELNVKSAEIEV